MDITARIIIKPSTNELSGLEAASRHRVGDFIEIFKSTRFAEMDENGNYYMQSQMGSDKFAFIHIKNIPNDKAKKFERILLRPLLILDSFVRCKEWHLPPSLLPETIRQKLLEDREYTIEFNSAKAHIRKKLTPVHLDPDQDDISTTLTDEDIN